ncbi:Inositol-3-phosphate synthase [Phytophthora palmivora]|uniref:Inositol-3-phosphate synthase n=1 Tax=Phytophthora palmivora TaxID=4796 RepID=A0A2P4XVA9_9STRA|nr:Inositol-3-phosphate synthase [Phytophthora palmivora]
MSGCTLYSALDLVDGYYQILMRESNIPLTAVSTRAGCSGRVSDGKDAKVDRLSPRQRAQLHRYELADGLLHYRVDPRDPPRVVVPNDEDLKYDILLEAHDAPISGHLGREKTYLLMVSQTFWWPRMYKWVAHYVKTCETCQRVKPSGHASAPLQSLPLPADCWKSMSLDFGFGLPGPMTRATPAYWCLSAV